VSAPPAVTAAKNRTATLLAVASFFSGCALRSCDKLLPRLTTEFAITPGAAGQLIIGFSIACGLMQLVFGPLGDSLGKMQMMCWALFGCAASALASALASGFDSLVLMRRFWGMASAGIIQLAMAWVGDSVPYEHLQPTLARFLTDTLSENMAGQLMGGLFADSQAGWRGAFINLATGYLVVAIMLFSFVRKQPHSALPADDAAAKSVVSSLVARIAEVLRAPRRRAPERAALGIVGRRAHGLRIARVVGNAVLGTDRSRGAVRRLRHVSVPLHLADTCDPDGSCRSQNIRRALRILPARRPGGQRDGERRDHRLIRLRAAAPAGRDWFGRSSIWFYARVAAAAQLIGVQFTNRTLF
jgi:MFS family permease